MTTLYLSGPMSGWENNNYPLFHEVAAILRDLMLPLLYLNAWGGSRFEWRGHAMRAVENARLS